MYVCMYECMYVCMLCYVDVDVDVDVYAHPLPERTFFPANWKHATRDTIPFGSRLHVLKRNAALL